MKKVDIIKKIVKKDSKIVTVYLFGSQATGRTTPMSDFDFAVLLDARVEEKDYFDYRIKLMAELGRIVKTDRVDVIILNSRNSSLLLKYNIIKNGKIIYCRDKSLKNRSEVKIMQRFLDWQYFEEIYHQIFLPRLAKGKI